MSDNTVEVRFTGEEQAITGDQWRTYEAVDDGEVIEVRTRCGAYVDGYGSRELPENARPWTDAEADAHAARELAARRERRRNHS